MINQSRRTFFKTVFTAGAALAASGIATRTGTAEALNPCRIKGVCLFVPSLGKAKEFVDEMNQRAPGEWTAHPLKGEMMDCYLEAGRLYEEAKGIANTFVGVVDPATFGVVHEAITDNGGSFHYVKYEERNRVTFSAQL
jgi:hypothetical protein